MDNKIVYIFFYSLVSESLFYDEVNLLEVSPSIKDKNLFVIDTPSFMTDYTDNKYVSFSKEQLDVIQRTQDYVMVYSFSLDDLIIVVEDYLKEQEDLMKILTIRSNNLISFINTRRK